jgi:type VI protein secretion system component Hcp
LEAIMGKRTSIIQQAVNGQFRPIGLSDQQLDNVTGGTKVVDKASPTLSTLCCTGKHMPKVTITAR